MATIMQKDAAIEMLSNTIAQISRYQSKYGETEENKFDWSNACAKRNMIYKTKHEELDYQNIVAFKTALKTKYLA